MNELADKIGISRQSLSKIEAGTTRPHLDTLELLADELDVSVDYLLGKSDNVNPHAEIGDLHMTDAAIYALRSNESYGKILSLLLENQAFKDTLREMDREFSATEDEGYNFVAHMYEKAIDKIREFKPEATADNDENIALLSEKAKRASIDSIEKYTPKIKEALASARETYHKDSAEREHLLLLQGAFDEIMDTSADSIKSGKPVDKKETILKMFTLIKEMGALNINPQKINQLTDIVGNMADRIEKSTQGKS